jgi:hypothetical protein
MNKRFLSRLVVLLFSTMACRPVIAIGWEEFLLFFILIAFLLGPPVYRFIRRIDDFRERRRKGKQ